MLFPPFHQDITTTTDWTSLSLKSIGFYIKMNIEIITITEIFYKGTPWCKLNNRKTFTVSAFMQLKLNLR